jgi:hypothetical protein
MIRKADNNRLYLGRRGGFLLAFVVIAIFLCPAAPSSMASPQSRLRGCLRITRERAFVLVGQDRLGYVLDGDRDTFSRHTDQEVEIVGVMTRESPDKMSVASLEAQVSTPGKKKDQRLVSIPGLPVIAVSALSPISQQCAPAPSAWPR